MTTNNFENVPDAFSVSTDVYSWGKFCLFSDQSEKPLAKWDWGLRPLLMNLNNREIIIQWFSGIRPQLIFNTFIILASRKFHNFAGTKQTTDSNNPTSVLN